jgi:hypothetical protein
LFLFLDLMSASETCCQRKGLIYRVPECLSLHLNWLPPSLQVSVCSPPPHLDPGGEDTLACGGGSGGSKLRRPARNSYTLCL